MSSPRTFCFILAACLILILCLWQPAQAAWSTNPSENTPVCVIEENQLRPQVLCDNAGGTIIAWQDFRWGHYDIYVQRLDSSGNELWAANGLEACAAAGSQIGHDMVSDGTGGTIIAWADYRSGSSEIYAQRVAPDGTMLWNVDGVLICSANGSLAELAMCEDGAGGAVIAWSQHRDGDYNIYVQQINESGSVLWTVDGVEVCTAPYNQYGINAVGDGAGGAILAWGDRRSGSSYDVYLQRVDDSGAMLWAANGISIGVASEDEQYPDLLADGAGGAFVAWFDDSSNNSKIYVQRFDSNGNQLWATGGEPVSSMSGGQENPAMTGDGQDGVIITWIDQRSVNYGIYAQRLDSNGMALWTVNGAAVCTAGGSQNDPQIVGDGYGGALFTWLDTRSSGSIDLYAQRMDTWGSLLWPEDGVPICLATDPQLHPVLCGNGDGGALIAWDDQRSGIDSDVYAQQVDWSGRRAGGVWAHDTDVNTPVCTAPDSQLEPQGVSDGSGGAIMAWIDHRSGIDYNIYSQRLSASGSNLWLVDGVGVCMVAGLQSGVQVISDGNGGAIFVWQDARSMSHFDIYAQRVDAMGNMLWTTDGVGICTATGDQERPRLVSDGAGGAIIVWEDERSSIDVYTQRVSASGIVQWSANGVYVDTTGESNANPDLVSNGDGGAIITWNERTLLYAQLVDAFGDLAWEPGGNVIVTQAQQLFGQRIVTDGAGGAIIAWSDDRSISHTDIYCQSVSHDGNVKWTMNGIPICTYTEDQFLYSIVSDGAGGAVIAWLDSRFLNPTVFAQHITHFGNKHWTPDGIQISSSEFPCHMIKMVEDGSSGAILAWRAIRSTTSTGIHAQRIDPSGDKLWAADSVAVGTAPPQTDYPIIIPDETGGAIFAFIDFRYGGSNIDINAQRVDTIGYPGDSSPTIKSVIDYPDDQGGVTIVSWEPSCYDVVPRQEITHYSVWSRLPEDSDRAGWTWVGEVPAYYLDEYGFNAPAYENYTGGTPFPLTEYRVMAHTADHWVFWESGVRSGCSVDNLAPGAPLTLLGLPDEADVLLTWEASGHHDEDLVHYNVYRGSTPGFVADENALVGTTTDIEFTDSNPGYGTWYYRVAGEDVHGNVGTASNEAAVPLSTSTVSASLSCMPSSGVLPFVTGFTVEMTNQYQGLARRIAGRIHVTLANGTSYGSWRAGFTNIAAGSTYVTSWNQPIPALAPLVGDNLFRLVAGDVTPSPFNQPPYPPAGDTDSATVTVTGMAP